MLIKNALRHIRNKDKAILLSSYYSVDWKNEIVTIDLYYKNASEVVFDKKVNTHMLDLRPEVFERISDIAECFPKKYKINIELEIEDYEGYSHEAILNAISAELELHYYLTVEDRDNRWFKALIFIIIATLFLLLEEVISQFELQEVVFFIPITVNMVDVCAWVFSWIAIEFVFIPDVRYLGVLRYIQSKLNKIALVESKNNKVLAMYLGKEIKSSWNVESTIHIVGKVILMLSLFFMSFSIIVLLGNLLSVDVIFDESVSDFYYIVAFIMVDFGVINVLLYLISWKSYKNSPKLKWVFNILFIIFVSLFVYTIIVWFCFYDDIKYHFIWIYLDVILLCGIASYIGFRMCETLTGIEKQLDSYKKKIKLG